MARPGPLDRTSEPHGDRPAAWDVTGGIWQRQGPRGTASWFCATDPAEEPLLCLGRSWRELDESIFGPMTPQPRPDQAPPAYTDAFPMPLLAEADTDPIAVRS